MSGEVGFDFFIAHAGADVKAAQKLCELLAHDSSVFLDAECLQPGDDWPKVIRDAQRRSRITLVLISDRTERAFYEVEEIAAAISLARETDGRHRVVPIYLSVLQPKDVPYGLRQKHGLEVTSSMPIEQVAKRLLAMHRTLRADIDAGSALGDGNTSPDPGGVSGPGGGRRHEYQILEQAERTARSIASPALQACSLWEVAKAVVGDDFHRYGQLLDTASLVIGSMTPADKLDWLLEEMAAAAAGLDLGRAEKMAYAISDASLKVDALVRIAQAASGSDSVKARTFLDDAERASRSIDSSLQRDKALARICPLLAGYDADRGERAARAIAHPARRATALAYLARTVAASEPRRADRMLTDANRIASSDPDEYTRVAALAGIAGAIALDDPSRAAQLLSEAQKLAESIADSFWRYNGLKDVVEAALPYDLDRAESAARAVTDVFAYGHPLEMVIDATLPHDPQRAERLARALPAVSVRALRRVAEFVVTDDPDHAEHIARNLPIQDPYYKFSVLVQVAAAVTAYDPGRARSLVKEIEDLIEEIEDELYESRLLAKAGVAIFGEDPDWARQLFDKAEELCSAVSERFGGQVSDGVG